MLNRNKYQSISLLLFSFISLIVGFIGCAQTKSQGPIGPIGYDLSKPKKYPMPDILQEISGIAFDKGDNKIVYAEMDEDGAIFSLPLGTKDEKKTKFGKKGDYEDVSIAKGWAILLKSNGDLYSFPLSETKNEEAKNVIESKDLLPKGEYEGMFADETTGNVYVLCKSCKQDKGSKITSGFIFSLQSNGTLKSAGNFKIDVSQVDKMSGKKKGTFHPSAIVMNPLTKEWYVVSSVNKALVITDSKFKIKNVYHLSSNEFNQPEGIAFDEAGNLYISNEGSETTVGNILRFDYKKP